MCRQRSLFMTLSRQSGGRPNQIEGDRTVLKFLDTHLKGKAPGTR